ncbi:ATPase, T2SS/T4P/T4SS family [Curvibacter sp. APW13]|uniref:ATPase, T2SS/T4P/T4SS family n=1 Tax=Curvibacter sp. APW13 TaxID=3077236 RepID=UPI0028DFDD24|nr:ATPase, T2SS/T4P/T4SS family [Curvibacter sp. APW13]MDT8992858.1 ATPase, T2SS/T4P/T4SS family [Curvibacter sp. APW13]
MNVGAPNTAAKKVISRIEELTRRDYSRLFGEADGVRIAEGVRSAACGLVHADGTVTVLITPDHMHIFPAFSKQMEEKGFKTTAPVLATSDFIFGLYAGSARENERRQNNSNISQADSDKILHDIVTKAMNAGASDIHIHVLQDARPPTSKVSFRIHGEYLLQKDLLTNPHIAHNICRAAYSGGAADSASRSDTSFKTTSGMYATLQLEPVRNVRLRLQTMPHVLGYGMNLRILSYDGMLDRYKDLVSMGFSEEHQREIVDAFSTEKGGLILFIAGTGEGKTTTVMTAVPMERKFESRNWVSIEDPVEIINPRLFQSPVKRKTGDKSDDSEHQAAIVNSLRFDPDGIIAGEIRDEITVKMAERAAMTGHVTAATLHGNDVFSAFNRLIDLGARKINLLDGVARVFCHQKLVQTLCKGCAKPASESTDPHTRIFLQELEETYHVDTSKVHVRGRGCKDCHPPGHPLAGIKGRTVVAETVRFNRQIVEALRDHEDTEAARRVWRSQRVAEYNEPGTLGKTLAEHALFKLLHGDISPETYIGVADSFDTHNPIPMQRRSSAV